MKGKKSAHGCPYFVCRFVCCPNLSNTPDMIFIGLSADGQLRTVSIGISPSLSLDSSKLCTHADRAFATEVSLSPLSVIAHHREQSCGQVIDSSACRLITSATTGMYLLKEYAVVNDLRETEEAFSHLYRGRSKHFFNLSLKIFLDFSQNFFIQLTNIGY